MAGSPDRSSFTHARGHGMNTPSNPIIEAFADIWCPFAHVGLRAVEEQRARSGRSDVSIWVRA